MEEADDPMSGLELEALDFSICSPMDLPSYRLGLAWFQPRQIPLTLKEELALRRVWRFRREVQRDYVAQIPIGKHSTHPPPSFDDPYPRFELFDMTFDVYSGELNKLSSGQLLALPFHPDQTPELIEEAIEVFYTRRERSISLQAQAPALDLKPTLSTSPEDKDRINPGTPPESTFDNTAEREELKPSTRPTDKLSVPATNSPSPSHDSFVTAEIDPSLPAEVSPPSTPKLSEEGSFPTQSPRSSPNLFLPRSSPGSSRKRRQGFDEHPQREKTLPPGSEDAVIESRLPPNQPPAVRSFTFSRNHEYVPEAVISRLSFIVIHNFDPATEPEEILQVLASIQPIAPIGVRMERGSKARVESAETGRRTVFAFAAYRNKEASLKGIEGLEGQFIRGERLSAESAPLQDPDVWRWHHFSAKYHQSFEESKYEIRVFDDGYLQGREVILNHQRQLCVHSLPLKITKEGAWLFFKNQSGLVGLRVVNFYGPSNEGVIWLAFIDGKERDRAMENLANVPYLGTKDRIRVSPMAPNRGRHWELDDFLPEYQKEIKELSKKRRDERN